VLGLLCYEVFLPLLIFNVAAYLFVFKKAEVSKVALSKRLALILATIITALLAGSLYQKKIVTLIFHADDNSRYHFRSLGYMLRRYIEDWYRFWYVLRYDFKVVVTQSAHLAYHHPWIIFTSLIAAALSVISSRSLMLSLHAKKSVPPKDAWWWVVAALLAIASTIALITLSLYPLTIEGYLNRLLFPIWFSFAFLCMALCYYMKPKYLLPIIALVTFSSAVVFQAELNKFVQGSEVRTAIQKDLHQKLETVPGENLAILADVPRCVPGSLLNEDIYSQQWDFGSVAKLTGGQKINQNKSSVIQLWNFQTANMFEASSTQLTLYGWFTISQKDMPVLYYHYDQASGKSSLVEFKTFDGLKTQIADLKVTARDNCKPMGPVEYEPGVDRLDAKLREILPGD
jgi:hypothetical protein